MATWWMVGGVWMWGVLLIGLLGLAGCGAAFLMAIVGRVAGGTWLGVARVLSAVMVLATLLPGLVGLLGMLDGHNRVAAALRTVDPAYAKELQEIGNAEARVPLQFGVGTSCSLFGLAVAALVVALPPTRRPLAG